MEENKNVQNNAELTDEQLEQTAGGSPDPRREVRLLKCQSCGKFYSFPINDVPESYTCTCGGAVTR